MRQGSGGANMLLEYRQTYCPRTKCEFLTWDNISTYSLCLASYALERRLLWCSAKSEGEIGLSCALVPCLQRRAFILRAGPLYRSNVAKHVASELSLQFRALLKFVFRASCRVFAPSEGLLTERYGRLQNFFGSSQCQQA